MSRWTVCHEPSGSATETYSHLSGDELRELVNAVERGGFPNGLAVLDEHPNREAVLFDLFHMSTEG